MKRLWWILGLLLLFGCSDGIDNHGIVEGRVIEVDDQKLVLETDEDNLVVYFDDHEDILSEIELADEVILSHTGVITNVSPRELHGDEVVEVIEHLSGVVLEDEVKVVIGAMDGQTLILDEADVTYEENLEVSVGDTVKVDLTKIRKGKKDLSALIRESEKTGALLDKREVVSGLIGAWPVAVLDGDGSVGVDQVFAFAIKKVPGFTYKVNLENFHFEMTGAGESTETCYYGFRALEVGKFQLVFDQYEAGVLKEQYKYIIDVK